MQKKKIQKKKAGKDDSIKKVANFLFEVGILAKTPRSGFHFLGTGSQSVAEHINRVCFIGYALAMMDSNIDVSKVLKMCLLHDITETRISDLNYVHQIYVERKEDVAINDIVNSIPFGQDINLSMKEYEERKSEESRIAKDADNLEWILTLKEELDTGNVRALGWIETAVKRLKTPIAQSIAKSIMDTDSNEWWSGTRGDDWWVNRGKK